VSAGAWTSVSAWSEDEAVRVIVAHADQRGPLLPILHALQETFGYVDARAIPLIAKTLNLSRADVYGVITFYKDFRSEPPGDVRVTVCRAEACQAMGGHELAEHARRTLGVDFGATTSDGAATLDQVFCLGNCAVAPSVTINGTLFGRVDQARFDRLLSSALGSRGTSGDRASDGASDGGP
jgi:formate dehydrogenase subunit gamma